MGRRPLRARGQAVLVIAALVLPVAFSTLGGAYLDHPSARTGAPGESTCHGCHGSYGVNSGDGYIMVSGMPDKYAPSTSYVLTVTVYSPNADRWCFVLTAVAEEEDHPIGVFSSVNTKETVTASGGKYIKTCRGGLGGAVNDVRTWQIQWTTPSQTDSAITFYGCGMGSNGGGTNGDRVYTCKMTVSPAPQLPGQPRALYAEAGDGQVTLSWMAPMGSMGQMMEYNIYWSDSSTGGLDLLTTVPSMEYLHTGLVNGHSYRYQVAAENEEGEGPLSDLVTTKPDLVPTKPRHMTSNGAEHDSVKLSWDAPSDWGQGGGNSYSLYRGKCLCMMERISTGMTQTSYSDPGPLEPNCTYYYRVEAVNTRGSGGAAVLTVDVPPASPGFPLDLSIMVDRGTVELSWQPPLDQGGDPVCCYRIYRAAPGQEPVLVKDHVMECSFVDSSVEADVTYEYTVAAVNMAGEGTLSTPVEAYIVPPPSSGDTSGVSFSEIPFSGLVVVGAVIIIGLVMVARLSHATSVAERKDRD